MRILIYLALVFVINLFPNNLNAQNPEWEIVILHAPFRERDSGEGFIFKDQLWLSNGYYHGNILFKDLWKSNDGLNWVKVLDNTPYDGYSEIVVFQNALYAVKESVWRSFDGITWNCIANTTPFGMRGYGETVVFQNALWQLGSGSDIWRSNDGISWSCVVNTAPWGNRYASSVIVFDNYIWILGGKTDGTNTPPELGYSNFTTHNDVWRSADGITWELVLQNAPWPPRMWFNSEVYRNRLWVFGGYDNVNYSNLSDVWYSEDGISWYQYASNNVFSPRHEATSYAWQDKLWVVAGNSWPVLNDVWRLSLPTDWPNNPQPSIQNNIDVPSTQIFPNPAQKIIYFSDLAEISTITIYDLLGNITFFKQNNTNNIDISSLQHGVYTMKIKTLKGTITKKIVKN